MIESHNPEINVDELMVKIREEVARRHTQIPSPLPLLSHSQGSVPMIIEWPRVNASLQAAEYHAQQVGDTTSEWMHFGRIKRKIARQVGLLILYLSKFIINKQKQFNLAALQSFRVIVDGLRSLENRVDEQVRYKEEIYQTLGMLRETIERIEQEQETVLQRVEAELVRREEQTQGLAHEVREVQVTLQNLKQEQETVLQRVEAELVRRKERESNIDKSLYQLKVNLVQQDHRLTLLLEEARRRLPEPFDQQQLQTFVTEEQHRLDALYVSFEDQFRGTREDIKERLRVYLPLLKEKGIGAEQMPIVDVGCGRGEWLELLREEGLLARGIDRNQVLIEQCQLLGLEVTADDLISYLHNCPDRSIGAVTGFHIIEHLDLDSLITLLDETVRVLVPGGVAIFETPNPQNMIVGSCNFYLDPTHRNPLPSSTMRFLAEARGLCRVQILDLHPYPAAFHLEGSALAERFNDYFYGPQDYAVVGWKV